jgi:hypothetical protein
LAGGLVLGLILGLGPMPILAGDVPGMTEATAKTDEKAKAKPRREQKQEQEQKQTNVAGESSATDSWSVMFGRGAVTEFRLRLDPEVLRSLGEQPRRFVPGTVGMAGRDPVRVAVRLKGGVGSFRPIGEKPSWTLDFARFEPGRRAGGEVERVQLNNAVEDPGYLNEAVGSEVFAEAGIPMPRVAHARVVLNGRELGLYVLKEGYPGAFLRRHFPGGMGALYDNDQGADIDVPLHRSSASGQPAGWVESLAQAIVEVEPSVRWRRMGEILDLDRYLTGLALEVLVGHRDGYGIARNNFRIYEDPGSGRVVFFPDGMDQLFGREEFPIRPRFGGGVARALMETEEGRRAYDLRLAALLEGAASLGTLTQRVDCWVVDLRPNLKEAEWRVVKVGADDLKARIVHREGWIRRQLGEVPPVRPEFEKGAVAIREWRPVDAGGATTLDEGPGPDGVSCLRAETSQTTRASWRARVWLGAGRYRLEGRARVAGVIPVAGLRTGGAGFRVQGAARSGPGLVGETGWQWLHHDFEVGEPGKVVELLCELVANAGRMWVDRDSLRLVREPAGAGAAEAAGAGLRSR